MKLVWTVKEVLERKVVVEAESERFAIWKVRDAYDASEIVLDYSDYHGDMDIECNGLASEIEIARCQHIGEEE